MEDFLIRKLSVVTDEEKRILSGKELDKKLYTEESDFIVHTDRLMRGRDISVRTHTRYTDFPLHRHNYLEIMIVLSGSITHEIHGESITLGEGDILVLNKHTSHAIKRADTPDIGVNVIISDSFVESLLKELSETVFSELAEQNSRPDGRSVYLCFSAKGNKQIANIVENLLVLMKQAIKKDDTLLISGFGKFEAYDKNARKGRNPQTDESITLPPRKVVVFRLSRKFRVELNGGEEE